MNKFYTNKSEKVVYPAIKEFDPDKHETFYFYDTIAIEKLVGNHLSFSIREDSIIIKNSSGNKINKGGLTHNLFKNRYEGKMKRLFINLNKAPFILYGTLVGSLIDNSVQYFSERDSMAIYFYDIRINSNWVNWDDFSDLIEKCGMKTPRILQEGNFREEVYYRQIVEKANIGGLIIKTIPEATDMSRDRLIAKFSKATKMILGPLVETYKDEVESFLLVKAIEKTKYWETLIEDKKIDRNNISEVMPLISGSFMIDIKYFLAGIFCKKDDKILTEEDFTKIARKVLPGIIRKILSI